MKTQIVLTGILRDKDLFLIVKRNENDNLYPGAWEFPGGHLEDGETIKEGLKRELLEEIGFTDEFNPRITHYYDEIKSKNGKLIYNLEIDFIINVDRSNLEIKLSNEHSEYKWVAIEELLDYDLADADVILTKFLIKKYIEEAKENNK
mgnify:CR=1 FL=1